MNDPAGVRWETFFTFGEATTYGEDPAMEAAIQAQATQGQNGACCGAPAPAVQPEAKAASCC